MKRARFASTRSARALATLAATLTATASVGCGDEEAAPCVTTVEYFTKKVSPVLAEHCYSCHRPDGEAQGSILILRDPAAPENDDGNFSTLQNVAAVEFEGTPLILLKPTNAIAHGGGELFAAGSGPHRVLEAFVERLSEPVECDQPDVPDIFQGVIQLDPPATLRKAALQLVGHLPTSEEEQAVAEGRLDEVLDQLLAEDAFYERLTEIWGDRLLTDRYIGGNNATNLLNAEDFPNRRWYDDEDHPASAEMKELGAQYANRSVAREPLDLIAHVVREGRPFTEILTADYLVVNPFSAISYGVDGRVQFTDPLDPGELREAKLAGEPHAGVLTSKLFLNRFPTTATNKNRDRARVVYDLFLATDVTAPADAPYDPTRATGENPTKTDATCKACHQTLDATGGAFLNWSGSGRYLPPEEGWDPLLWPPGFEDQAVPQQDLPRAAAWLGERLAADPRFVQAVVRTMFHALTGQEPLGDPGTAGEGDDPDPATLAYQAQSGALALLGSAFVQSGHDLRALVKAIVQSAWFRASDTFAAPTEEQLAQLAEVGTARLITPERLTRKIEAVTGFPWRNRPQDSDYLLGDYRIYYGGINADTITDRLTRPSGVHAQVIWRMANEVACRVTARDFTANRTERALFPKVEITFAPEDENGFVIEGAVDAIRENIQYLHRRVLGELLPVTDAEIDRTYELFYEVWRQGYQELRNEEADVWLPGACRAQTDWWTGEELPEAKWVRQDPKYIVRAWMAVMTYLLADFRFVYE